MPEKIFGAPFEAGSISAEISPELLGVGYIIGPRIASIMCAGGVLAYLVLIPAIKFFGDGLDRRRSRRAPCRSATWRPTRSAAPTSSTSAPARWPRAASSACSARCRRSGTACKGGLEDFAAARAAGGADGDAAHRPDLSMKFVGSAASSR